MLPVQQMFLIIILFHKFKLFTDMKFLIYFISVFFNCYNRGKNKDIAYEYGIAVFSIIFLTNILTLLIAFGVPLYFDIELFSKFQTYIIFSLIIFATSFTFSKIATKKRLLEIDYKKRDIYTDYIVLFSYVISSLILLIIVVLRSKS